MPQPVRDASNLSFVSPHATFAELASSVLPSDARATSTSSNTVTLDTTEASERDFDWRMFLNDDNENENDGTHEADATGTTPELIESRPDEDTPSNKDEAKTPDNAALALRNKASLSQLKPQQSPKMMESQLSRSSSSSSKRKLADDEKTSSAEAVSDSSKRRRSEVETFDLSDPESFSQVAWPRADFFKTSTS